MTRDTAAGATPPGVKLFVRNTAAEVIVWCFLLPFGVVAVVVVVVDVDLVIVVEVISFWAFPSKIVIIPITLRKVSGFPQNFRSLTNAVQSSPCKILDPPPSTYVERVWCQQSMRQQFIIWQAALAFLLSKKVLLRNTFSVATSTLKTYTNFLEQATLLTCEGENKK